MPWVGRFFTEPKALQGREKKEERMIVIVEYEILTADDKVLKSLYEKTKQEGSDLVDIPDLPGITFQSISSVSDSWNELNLARLISHIQVAADGEEPSKILLVSKKHKKTQKSEA